jgi:glycerol-3-phosphate acyltransferase PlsY
MTIDVFFLLVIAPYLIGSIPFGLLLGFLTGKGDIRKIGSGNIGATNMMRAGGKKLAALTLILDGLKGFIPCYFISQTPLITWLPFTFAILGHIFPIWLKFKGGKGVATFLGGLFGLHWMAGVIFIVCWLGMFALKRISALSALTALIISPISIFILTGDIHVTIAVTAMAALIIYRHKDNITRLLSGNELGFSVTKDNT